MARKLKPLLHRPQPFNDRAHEIVASIINAAELVLIRKRLCEPHETDEYLTMEYIKDCGTFLEHSTFYLESEGRIAADLFLGRLSNAAKAALKARYHRYWLDCALQLHWHTHLYFRDYHEVLSETYLKLLQRLPNLRAIDQSGVLKLAAANLPNVKTDILRERRRRGAESDRTIVGDEIIVRRLNHIYRRGVECILKLYEAKYPETP